MNDLLVFETTRLIATSWSPDHAQDALEIYGDPQVTKFIGGETIESVDDMRRQIEKILLKYESLPSGMGSFPVFLKSTGSLVGTALIKPLPGLDGSPTEEIEIGWHLAKRQWGRGYATEWGKKLIELGIENLKLERLHAVVDPPNEKSKQVAIRLGMQHLGLTTEYYEGKPVDHFLLTKEDYYERIIS